VTTIFDRLKKVIGEMLGVDEDQITYETSFVDDLNADSSDLVELITAIEEEFSTPEQKLEILDEDAKGIITVQNVIDCLRDCGLEN